MTNKYKFVLYFEEMVLKQWQFNEQAMLIYHSILCLMLKALMNLATQHDPHREEHMKDSLACISCVVTLAGYITVLCLYLKQARDTKEKGVCICVCVFWLMGGWMQVSSLERRKSLMLAILAMQMTAWVHILDGKWSHPNNTRVTSVDSFERLYSE